MNQQTIHTRTHAHTHIAFPPTNRIPEKKHCPLSAAPHPNHFHPILNSTHTSQSKILIRGFTLLLSHSWCLFVCLCVCSDRRHTPKHSHKMFKLWVIWCACVLRVYDVQYMHMSVNHRHSCDVAVLKGKPVPKYPYTADDFEKNDTGNAQICTQIRTTYIKSLFTTYNNSNKNDTMPSFAWIKKENFNENDTVLCSVVLYTCIVSLANGYNECI